MPSGPVTAPAFEALSGLKLWKGADVAAATIEWRLGEEQSVPLRDSLLNELPVVPQWANGMGPSNAFFFWVLSELSRVRPVRVEDLARVREFVNGIVSTSEPRRRPKCTITRDEVESSTYGVDVTISQQAEIVDRGDGGDLHSAFLADSTSAVPGLNAVSLRFWRRPSSSATSIFAKKFGPGTLLHVKFEHSDVPLELALSTKRAEPGSETGRRALAAFALHPKRDTLRGYQEAQYALETRLLSAVAERALLLGLDTTTPWEPLCHVRPLDGAFAYSCVPLGAAATWFLGSASLPSASPLAATRGFLSAIEPSVATVALAKGDVSVETNANPSGTVSQEMLDRIMAAYRKSYPVATAGQQQGTWFPELARESWHCTLDSHAFDPAVQSTQGLSANLPNPSELPRTSPTVLEVTFGRFKGTIVARGRARGPSVSLTSGMSQMVADSDAAFEASDCDLLRTLHVRSVSTSAPATLSPALLEGLNLCTPAERKSELAEYVRRVVVDERADADGSSLSQLVSDESTQRSFLERVMGPAGAQFLSNRGSREPHESYAFLRSPAFVSYVFQLRTTLPSSLRAIGVADFTQSLGPDEVLIIDASGQACEGLVAIARNNVIGVADIGRFTSVRPPAVLGHLRSVIVFGRSASFAASCDGERFTALFDSDLVSLIGDAATDARENVRAPAVVRGTSLAVSTANLVGNSEFCPPPTLMRLYRRLRERGHSTDAASVAGYLQHSIEGYPVRWMDVSPVVNRHRDDLVSAPHFSNEAASGRHRSVSVTGLVFDAMVAAVLDTHPSTFDVTRSGTLSSALQSHALRFQTIGARADEEPEKGAEVNKAAAHAEATADLTKPPSSYSQLLSVMALPTPCPPKRQTFQLGSENENNDVPRQRWERAWGIRARLGDVSRSFLSDLYTIELESDVPEQRLHSLALDAWCHGLGHIAWGFLQRQSGNLAREFRTKRDQVLGCFAFLRGLSPAEIKNSLLPAGVEPDQHLVFDPSCTPVRKSIKSAEKALADVSSIPLGHQLAARRGEPPLVGSQEVATPFEARDKALGALGVPRKPMMKVLKPSGEEDTYVCVVRYSDREKKEDVSLKHLDTVAWYFSRVRALKLRAIYRGAFPRGDERSHPRRVFNYTMYFDVTSVDDLATEDKLLNELDDRLRATCAATEAAARCSAKMKAMREAGNDILKPTERATPKQAPERPHKDHTKTTTDVSFKAPDAAALRITQPASQPKAFRHADPGHFKTTAGESYSSPRTVRPKQPTRDSASPRREDRSFATSYSEAFVGRKSSD